MLNVSAHGLRRCLLRVLLLGLQLLLSRPRGIAGCLRLPLRLLRYGFLLLCLLLCSRRLAQVQQLLSSSQIPVTARAHICTPTCPTPGQSCNLAIPADYHNSSRLMMPLGPPTALPLRSSSRWLLASGTPAQPHTLSALPPWRRWPGASSQPSKDFIVSAVGTPARCSDTPHMSATCTGSLTVKGHSEAAISVSKASKCIHTRLISQPAAPWTATPPHPPHKYQKRCR